jgi:hypothetical protein
MFSGATAMLAVLGCAAPPRLAVVMLTAFDFTLLALGCCSGAVACVGWLVEKGGASLTALDAEGRSCLDLAALLFSAVPERARQVILDYLKSKGAAFVAIDDAFIAESAAAAPALQAKAKQLLAAQQTVAEGAEEQESEDVTQ